MHHLKQLGNGTVEGLKEAGEYALKNNIRLTLEAWNRYETYLITKLDMALKMVNEVGLENVGVMGDTFHMNIEESNMGDAIRNVGKKLYYLHIADSNRAAPGRGHIDFEEIAQALKDIDYNGWISMELLPAAANPFSGIVQEAFRNQLNRKSLRYNWHTAEVTVLEGVFARGDRKVGKVLEEAYRLGCIYDAWDEYFDYDKWLQAFENTGVDMDFYNLRKRELDEIFPWDFINCGVTKSFLIREWKNAMEGNVTPNCRAKCSGCGAASYGGGVCFEGKN